jgi:SPP1 gp7 family putative phage head morphogenesis protein
MLPVATGRLIVGQRQQVNLLADAVAADVARDLAAVSDRASRDLRRLIAAEAELAGAGGRLSLSQMRQRERAQNILLTVQNELARLAEQGVVTATNAVTGQVVPLAVDWENRLIRSQLPANLQGFGVRVSPAVLEAVVSRADERLGYLRRMTADTARTVNRVLLEGIAVGQNPRDAARTLMMRVNRTLDGGVVRAERLMRTEMLDAYRNAQTVVTADNTDVVGEVEWWASADDRTCVSCWAMHGERFPVGTAGPDDHPNGRCVFIPVVNPEFAALLPEGPSKEELWGRLSPEQQQRVLGPSRYDLTGGGPPTRAMSTQVPAGEWRAYRVATPVRDLVA